MAVAFELFELTGKRALVTGSSQGIGFALAQGLAEHGAEVVLNGRDAGKLDAAAAKLAAAGHKVSVADFDVTLAQAVKEGVAAIEGNSGDGHNQLPKLLLGVTFNDGIEVIAKPTDRQPATAAA
jgi:NAD(P)-dependent dehydrogenase (short-subunit alcohol dehydrogenase family)